jgi:hypothetical protein
MGVYWKVVNVTRKEFIDPHSVGASAKLGGWDSPDGPVMTLVRERWSATDDVRAVPDTGSGPDFDTQVSGVRGETSVTYEDLWNDGGLSPDDYAEEEALDGPPQYALLIDERFKPQDDE